MVFEIQDYIKELKQDKGNLKGIDEEKIKFRDKYSNTVFQLVNSQF